MVFSKTFKSWEYDVLQIYNLTHYGPLFHWFDFLINESWGIEGDVLEAGVWKGRSLISGAIALQENSINKTIYGFDTFSGFPESEDPRDEPSYFKEMFKAGLISAEHLSDHQTNMRHMSYIKKVAITSRTFSSSGDFSETDPMKILSKAEYLQLENLKVIPGPFEETMNHNSELYGNKWSAVLLDCDLYESYITTLNFVWPSLSIGGMVYLDEYYSLKFPGARKACLEFLANKKVSYHHEIDKNNGFERWWVIKEGN